MKDPLEKGQNQENSGQDGTKPENSKPETPKTVKNPKKNTQKRKIGGDKKMTRNDAEKVLVKVAKSLKLQTKRIAAKRDSKSGVGALQALHKDGTVKVCVRTNDILAYMPSDKLGYGRSAPGRYVHITILDVNDPNLEKAFRKALQDKNNKNFWAKKMGHVPRLQKGMSTDNLDAIKDRKAKLQDELATLKKAERKAKAKKTKKATKSTEKRNKAITKVAAEVAA